MKRFERILSTIVSYPLTWAALFTVIALVWGGIKWFEPPLLISLAMVATGLVLLLLWPVLFFRSQDFWNRYNRMPSDISMEDLKKMLSECHPAFRQTGMDYLAMVDKIRQEFQARTFQDEVDGLTRNLTELTRNHLQLYTRSRQFGTAEQKQDMDNLIRSQVKSVEDSLTALNRFSGNLTLFDSQVTAQKEIDTELKLINQGLQEAIKEVQHG
jgi:hypothetical protein